MIRTAGGSAQLMGKEGKYVTMRIASGEMRMILAECRATVGQVGNLTMRTSSTARPARSAGSASTCTTGALSCRPATIRTAAARRSRRLDAKRVRFRRQVFARTDSAPAATSQHRSIVRRRGSK